MQTISLSVLANEETQINTKSQEANIKLKLNNQLI